MFCVGNNEAYLHISLAAAPCHSLDIVRNVAFAMFLSNTMSSTLLRLKWIHQHDICMTDVEAPVTMTPNGVDSSFSFSMMHHTNVAGVLVTCLWAGDQRQLLACNQCVAYSCVWRICMQHQRMSMHAQRQGTSSQEAQVSTVYSIALILHHTNHLQWRIPRVD